MKRLLTASCLTAALVVLTGCQQAAKTAPTTTGSTVVPTTNAKTSSAESAPGIVKVSLAVPNMSWGGCASSVRAALESIDGVINIETDHEKMICSFEVSKPDVDYKSQLEKLAATNEHLKDFSIQ